MPSPDDPSTIAYEAGRQMAQLVDSAWLRALGHNAFAAPAREFTRMNDFSRYTHWVAAGGNYTLDDDSYAELHEQIDAYREFRHRELN